MKANKKIKRLLKNSIYFAITAAIIFLASRVYDKSGDRVDSGCEQSIKNATFPGSNPQEKISYLADCINVVHGENLSVSGFYNRRTNWIEYEVNLDFKRPDTPPEYTLLKEAEKRVIGELAVTTARLLVPDISGDYEGIGIYGMKISVSKIHVSRRDADVKGELFFEDAPFLQHGRIGESYFFTRGDLEKLAKETNVLNWEIYQSPSLWTGNCPGVGTVEKPKPKPSDSAAEGE
jgi:hypothetical protein